MELNSEEILRTVFEELELKESDFNYFALLRCKRALDDRLADYEDEVDSKATENLYTEEEYDDAIRDTREEERSNTLEEVDDAIRDAIENYFSSNDDDEISTFAEEKGFVSDLIDAVTSELDGI